MYTSRQTQQMAQIIKQDHLGPISHHTRDHHMRKILIHARESHPSTKNPHKTKEEKEWSFYLGTDFQSLIFFEKTQLYTKTWN